MSAVNDLVKLGYPVVKAQVVQAALEGNATASDLVRQGFSVNQAEAILAEPPTVGRLAKHGVWAALAGIIVAEYEAVNSNNGEPEEPNE